MHSWRKAAWLGWCGSRERIEPVVRDVVRPVDVQGVRGTAQPAHRAARCGREGAEDSGAVRDHQVRRRHAGEQGDLGVPGFGGERGAVRQLVGVAPFDDLLLGHVERDAATLDLQRLPQHADLLEERERLLRETGVDLPLYARVVEPGPAADEGPVDVDGGRAALRVQVEGPQRGGADLVREQAGGALAQDGGVQRDLPVGEVEGGRPPVGLRVQGRTGYDERGDVGDGVPDAVAGAPPGQVHRLVQVGGAGGVDGEERDVRGVLGGEHGCLRRALGLGEHLRRETLGHREFGAQCGEGGPERGFGCAGHADAAAGHTASVGPVRRISSEERHSA
ncbi:hypothetical protein SALBM311S_03875 [Streptomyces alboniger]